MNHNTEQELVNAADTVKKNFRFLERTGQLDPLFFICHRNHISDYYICRSAHQS